MLADSHAHLDDPKFGEDREAVVRRAWDAGVRTILTIGNGVGPDDMGCGIPIAGAYDWVYTTVGVHPHDAVRVEARHLTLLEELAEQDQVVAIGETGLDFYYDNSPRDTQQDVFRAQLEVAVRLSMPVIIHTRAADTETIEILRDVRPERGVVHCFTGGEALAECALDLGLMISFSGIVTFKTADSIRSIAESVPDDRILVETDSPYLAPVPHRGKRNEPAFVVETAEKVARVRGMTVEELAEKTSRNFGELFGVGG
jgi:TatD DNase family protein